MRRARLAPTALAILLFLIPSVLAANGTNASVNTTWSAISGGTSNGTIVVRTTMDWNPSAYGNGSGYAASVSAFALLPSSPALAPPSPPPPSNNGGGSDGGGGGGVAPPPAVVLNNAPIFSKMSLFSIVKFSLASHEHSLRIKRIAGKTVTLIIASTPKEVNVTEGMPQKVDIDNDGTPDIIVSVMNVTADGALVSIQKIIIPVPVVKTNATVAKNETPKPAAHAAQPANTTLMNTTPLNTTLTTTPAKPDHNILYFLLAVVIMITCVSFYWLYIKRD